MSPTVTTLICNLKSHSFDLQFSVICPRKYNCYYINKIILYYFQIWVQNVGCECKLGNHLRYLILLVSSRNLHFSCPKKIVMAILGSDAVRSRVFWLNCSEFFNRKGHTSVYNGILFPKLFWPTVRKSCSSDQEKLLDSRLKAKNFQK